MEYIARCSCGAGMNRAFLKYGQRPRDAEAIEWLDYHTGTAVHTVTERWG